MTPLFWSHCKSSRKRVENTQSEKLKAEKSVKLSFTEEVMIRYLLAVNEVRPFFSKSLDQLFKKIILKIDVGIKNIYDV